MDSVKELLRDQYFGQRRAQGVLCYLFRTVLLWRQVTYISWDKRLNRYFERAHNRNKPLDKGNLNKFLIADDMSWGAFMKGIDFLNPIAASLAINLTWRDGRTSNYVVALDPAEDQDDPDPSPFDYEGCSIFLDVQTRAPSKKKSKRKDLPLNKVALLFRHIVVKEQVADQWAELLEAYVQNPLNGVSQNKRDLNSAISQLQRSLQEPNLTWNIFRRGLQVLNPVREEYVLTLHWTNDRRVIELDPNAEKTIAVAAFHDPYVTETPHADHP